MSIFQPAIRRKVFVKLAVQGPSGSGKTYSALRLAFGMGERIALVDTENKSASLYAGIDRDGIGPFDVADVEPPFEPKKYIAAIEAAAAAGYDVLIIDSFSHAWKEILNMKEAFDRQGGNSFANWSKVKPLADKLKQAILQSPIHIIACMRAKDEYVLDDKNKPQKVGMGAIQEPGVEYEFTTVFDLGMDHKASTSKDRTGLFGDEIQVITPDHGKRLIEWLSGAAAAPAPVTPAARSAPAPAAGTDAAAVKAAMKEFKAEAIRLGFAERVTSMDAVAAWAGEFAPTLVAKKPNPYDWSVSAWHKLTALLSSLADPFKDEEGETEPEAGAQETDDDAPFGATMPEPEPVGASA